MEDTYIVTNNNNRPMLNFKKPTNTCLDICTSPGSTYLKAQ